MKKNYKNSYVYKTILTLVVLVSIGLFSVSSMFLLYYMDSGLIVDEKDRISMHMDGVTDYYETRALEQMHYGLNTVDLDNTNFHYAIIEGSDTSTAVDELNSGKAAIIKGNITSIPTDSNAHITWAEIGDSTGFFYSDTSSGFLLPNRLGGGVDNQNTLASDPSNKNYLILSYYGQKEGETLESYVADFNNGYCLNTEYDDLYVQQCRDLRKIVSLRSWLITGIIAGLLLMVVCGILLAAEAGHHETPHPKSKPENYITLPDGSGVIELRGFDHIPMDLYAFAELCLLGGIFAVAEESGEWWTFLVFMGMLLVALFPFIISLAVNIKIGGLWKRTLIMRVFSALKRFGNKLSDLTLQGTGVAVLQRRAWITYGALFLLHLFACLFLLSNSYLDEVGFLFLLLFLGAWGFIAWRLTRWLASMSAIVKGTAAVADGDMAYAIDTTGMPADLSRLSDNINHIRAGLDAAVEERMKSDRMQTELITNVSHDIRTPLTSIVNYVDLLSKEELGSEKAKEYVEVLSRQAQRLKKLISDLIDASKATSGAIKLDMQEINASVLLTQAVGEYSEKLASKNINMVVESPKQDIIVKADPQQLWRVFDNLLGNAVKYGQEGTRAYVDVEAPGENGLTSIIFRNISAAPLHISGEELMQRFVRGDSARSTEGSGLGLSIARSLTELMGGYFGLMVDGDLFKVVLQFPVVNS